MLSTISLLLRVPAIILATTLNTVLHATPLLALGLLKVLLPGASSRARISLWLVWLAESWIAVNSLLIDLATPTRFEISGLEGLRYEGWYLVLSNHQSWVDIPVLQRVFNRRIPFLKFFLKRQLIWVPLLGLAWWALDFPFMRRHSQAEIACRPELRGQDLAATRKACERFKTIPVSVMNFVEGTRFTPEKHASQQSPYRHLLKPKAGGVAFVLGAMGDCLQAVLDVTVIYPHGRPTLIDLLAGRIPLVKVEVKQLPVPTELVGGDYEGNSEYRNAFQNWVNRLWAEKDRRIAKLNVA